MASGWTNRWKKTILDIVYRGATTPTHFYIALVTSDTVPGVDTNVLGDLTEIPAGNGYTAGGYEVDRNATDFDFLEEDDANDLGRIQLKDIEWTASAGPIPSSGTAAYAVMTDDNVTLADRIVCHFWSLGGERSVQDGSPLRLINLELRGIEPAP